jgi:nifR3 family TIM-barrel protein
MFSWKKIKKPFLVLAPMADISTWPFRSLCKEMGADVVFTPMVSSDAICHNFKKTKEIIFFKKEEQPVIVQVFGYDPKIISEAVSIIDKKLKPAGIDINMGCPAVKITGNESGSALLRDKKRALKIVKAVRKTYSGQLSVKLRLGWSQFDTLDFVKDLEKLKVDALTIHGRTVKQGFTGQADWSKINQVAKAVNIPVIGNGDIVSWEQAYEKLKNTNLSGVMIGRGALGNPWIFKAIKKKKDIKVSKKELAKIIKEQTKRYILYTGEKRAMLEMRKHYAKYFRGFEGAQELRQKAVLINSLKSLEKILKMI